MNLSYNWLKEFLPDLSLAPEDLAQLLTLHSFETNILKEISLDPGLRVVKIIKIEPHPRADRLRLVTLTDGSRETRVVCGANNINEGDVVPYAPPGSSVLDENGNPFCIQDINIRGERSPGMLTSVRELGLGTDHGGIWILPSDVPLGDALCKLVPQDFILMSDITPNRSHDCMSHFGVAREIAALTQISIREFSEETLEKTREDADIELSIDPTGTPRYMALVIDGVRNGVSPLWMQVRLLQIGARPISAAVDITNYVMFEVGNPSHVFDREKLPGNIIGVRPANKNEHISLLDGMTYHVPEQALVITSNDVPVALAGIMGGVSTQVTPATQRLLVEIANFDAHTISRARAKLHLMTEASARFTRGLDAHLVAFAASRVATLMRAICGADVKEVLDHYPAPKAGAVICLSVNKASKIAGMKITLEQQSAILQRLRCSVKESGNSLVVEPPTDRLDLEGEHDLVEEIVRMIGLETIPQAQLRELHAIAQPQAIVQREQIRDFLVSLGFTETYTFSFEPENFVHFFQEEDDTAMSPLHVKNPPSPEMGTLRRSLLPGIANHMAGNTALLYRKRSVTERALFEIGHVYGRQRTNEQRVPGVQEDLCVAGMFVGTAHDATMIVERIFQKLGVKHDKKGIHVRVGQLSADGVRAIHARMPVAFFEINLDELIRRVPPSSVAPSVSLKDIRSDDVRRYVPVSSFPSVVRDVSLVVDHRIAPEKVIELISRTGSDLVTDLELFDEYALKEKSQKSLAFHIEYQAVDRTLTDKEVNEVHERILRSLQEELRARIR